MQNVWAYCILALAFLSAVASWNIPRAAAWIALAMTSFIASSLFWDFTHQKDAHTLLTFTCDALVVLIICSMMRERWEIVVAGAYMASVTFSLIRLTGGIQTGWIYASCLEACNYLALLTIGGMGIMDRIARHANNPPLFVLRGIRSFRDAIH